MLLRSALCLAIALSGLLATAPGAEAGVSYDFVFGPGGGGFANGNQYTFPSVSAANSGMAVVDLLLRTSDSLVFHSVSVGFDDGLGIGWA